MISVDLFCSLFCIYVICLDHALVNGGSQTVLNNAVSFGWSWMNFSFIKHMPHTLRMKRMVYIYIYKCIEACIKESIMPSYNSFVNLNHSIKEIFECDYLLCSWSCCSSRWVVAQLTLLSLLPSKSLVFKPLLYNKKKKWCFRCHSFVYRLNCKFCITYPFQLKFNILVGRALFFLLVN